jgi:molybdate transport system substrate-binding protein
MTVLKVLAAGSLRQAFGFLADAFVSSGGEKFDIDYSHAGLLYDRIKNGEKADLFATADTIHPEKLLAEGLALRVVPFAGNSLCLLVRKELELEFGLDWFAALTNPKSVLGISVPGASPCGDYTIKLFENIEKNYPGVGIELKNRAAFIAYGNDRQKMPDKTFINPDEADVAIVYKSIGQPSGNLRIIPISNDCNVFATYSLAIMTPESKTGSAEKLAAFILSDTGKECLQKAGFSL